MDSFLTNRRRSEPGDVPDKCLMPRWILNSQASALPCDYFQRLGEDLKDYENALTRELNLSFGKSLSQSLQDWSRYPGSTLFVLMGALDTIGRGDWVEVIQEEMVRLYDMQLYVMVSETGRPDCHYTQRTSGETTIIRVLENILGGDLIHFKIVGPELWVNWDTKAIKLKGQQLTLQKFPAPISQTQNALYGSRVETTVPKYPNTMPSNIQGGDANYNLHQPNKACEMEKLKLPDSSDSISSYSDNNVMEVGLSELVNCRSHIEDHCDKSFETLTVDEKYDQFTIDDSESTHQKVRYIKEDSVLGLENSNNILDNVPYLSIFQSQTLIPETVNSGQRCVQSEQNDLNCGHESGRLLARNYLESESPSGAQFVHPAEQSHNDEGSYLPSFLDKNVNGDQFAMDTDENSQAAHSVNKSVMRTVPNFLEYPEEISQGLDVPMHAEDEENGDYVAHNFIKKIISQDGGNSKRYSGPPPSGSPIASHCKRRCSFPDLSSQQNVPRSQQQMSSSFRPPLIHAETQQLDFENISNDKVRGSSWVDNLNATKLQQAKEMHFENIQEQTNRPHYENVQGQDLNIQHELHDGSKSMSVKVNISYDSDGISEQPLLCHTPPPSFPDSHAPQRSPSSSMPEKQQTVQAHDSLLPSPVFAFGCVSQSAHRVKYKNTASSDRIYPGDNAQFVPIRQHGDGTQPGQAHISNVEYMPMTRNGLVQTSQNATASNQDSMLQTSMHSSPVANRHLPPIPPQEIRSVDQAACVNITASDHICATRTPRPTGREVYDEPGMTEEEHYHLIDSRIPLTPTRMPSLEGQLAMIRGWSPLINGSTIQTIMTNYQEEDGNFVLWRSRRLNQFIITVSHRRKLVHYCILKQKRANGRTVYFLYEGGFKSETLLEVVKHYVEHGIRMPISSGFGASAQRFMDLVRLLRPLIVDPRPRNRGHKEPSNR